jgi:hypothetical protein
VPKKTRDCLRRLCLLDDVHQERTLGTEMYLQICSDYIDIFLSEKLDLRSRVVLASKVSFFFWIWKLWLKHGHHGVLGNNKSCHAADSFVSQQCFIDLQMSCHFVVLRTFRDKYPSLAVPLSLTRSDSCENFFSKVGGMLGMERAYEFHELGRVANTMNQLSEVEYGKNGLQFGRVHNKMTNIWAKLHPLESREHKAGLGDYTLVGTDDLLVEAMKEGLLEAQKMLRSLNMAPSAIAKHKKWFTQPWTVERTDAKHFAYIPSKTPVADEDGDAEYLRYTLEIQAQNADDNLYNDDNPRQEAELTAEEFDATEDA